MGGPSALAESCFAACWGGFPAGQLGAGFATLGALVQLSGSRSLEPVSSRRGSLRGTLLRGVVAGVSTGASRIPGAQW